MIRHFEIVLAAAVIGGRANRIRAAGDGGSYY
jgi:hypothetical protein